MISAPSRLAALTPAQVVPLPHASTSASDGRRALRDDLTNRQVHPAVLDAAVLVVSELLSNAVRHARPLPSGKVELRWAVGRNGVTLGVSDGGSATRPRANALTRSATGGRGLGIVDAVSQEWGVDEESGRTTVWAYLVPPVRGLGSGQSEATDRPQVVSEPPVADERPLSSVQRLASAGERSVSEAEGAPSTGQRPQTIYRAAAAEAPDPGREQPGRQPDEGGEQPPRRGPKHRLVLPPD